MKSGRFRGAMLLLMVLLMWGGALGGLEGDLRTRLRRRFPDCRGTLESVYAGDEFDFYQRLRFGGGTLSGLLLLDKSRGEEWIDTAAGGIAWTGPPGPLLGVYAGWLKAYLGSGLVLSHPGQWGSQDGLILYKPPVIRQRVSPATSPTGVRGDPLTGIGADLALLGSEISLLLCRSNRDGSGEGYHRTASEIEGKGAEAEWLGAVRVSRWGFGITAAAATVDGPEYAESWTRAGMDWDIPLPGIRLTGEAALGEASGDDRISTALWAALCQNREGFRHTLTFVHTPDSYPSQRSTAPVGPSTGTGLSYGLRWRVGRGLTLKTGASAFTSDGSGLFRGAAELSARLPFSMEVRTGIKIRSDADENGWRLWLSSSWKPLDRLSVSSRLQLTRSSQADSTDAEQGFGLQSKLGWDISPFVSTGFSCTAFSTDGYSSRVYSSDVSLPGEFASSALWGKGFRMSVRVSWTIREGLVIRLSGAHTHRENSSSIGTGWEETEGGDRTEAGLQVDCSFP